MLEDLTMFAFLIGEVLVFVSMAVLVGMAVEWGVSLLRRGLGG